MIEMKIQCIGGGPAGIYFASLMKIRNPAHEVTVIESNQAGETTGWGLVLTDGLLTKLEANDPVSARRIRDSLISWSNVEVEVKGRRVTSGGHGFLGISRLNLITILQQRAEELGVAVDYERWYDPGELPGSDADLIVASDGANSRIRTCYPNWFDAHNDLRPNKYIWLGTRKTFENAFKFIFERTPGGWVWAHCYQFDANTSAFVVECCEDTWRNLGFDVMTPEEAAERCREIFAAHLDGHPLLINDARRRRSLWTSFNVVRCGRWHHGRTVLLGNSAHTAHFSIGSGTRIALEDAIALADALDGLERPDPERLGAYQELRQAQTARLHAAAMNSMLWFENIAPYLDQDPLQFTYALLTRSRRIGHESLRGRDEDWIRKVESWFLRQSGAVASSGRADAAARPSLVPLTLRGITLKNRIVSEYPPAGPNGRRTSSDAPESGAPGESAGLAMIEVRVGSALDDATAMSGLVSRVRQDGWDCVGARLVPAPDDRRAVAAEERGAASWRHYVASVARASKAGLDLLELDLGADPALFLPRGAGPGSADSRPDVEADMAARLVPAIRMFRAVRDAWPADRPISVRLGGLREPGGRPISPERLAAAAKLFRDEDVDILDVPLDWRMHVVGAPRIAGSKRKPVTLAVGPVDKPDQIDALILAGRADLCRPVQGSLYVA
jgi:anthraniloyl-CoA monooxygenase